VDAKRQRRGRGDHREAEDDRADREDLLVGVGAERLRARAERVHRRRHAIPRSFAVGQRRAYHAWRQAFALFSPSQLCWTSGYGVVFAGAASSAERAAFSRLLSRTRCAKQPVCPPAPIVEQLPMLLVPTPVSIVPCALAAQLSFCGVIWKSGKRRERVRGLFHAQDLYIYLPMLAMHRS
jgi:hypothetical protein